ncbi:DUF1345 domain-containing protein [Acinetobacter apis]|uniref:Uncharacterized membrane protein n=1 Tax=Acinetobacter apis TaxID=1229165 RepID=A0A217EGQ8_9GAMM|nr:DUF1345 domain-containing protein [Acinetobacter apis]SNQ29681.1 Uncharacterized membrane protein [Acinetobacter apis]
MSFIRKIYRGIRYHPRFYFMLPFGLMIGLILHNLTSWTWSTTVLVCWNSAISLYLLTTYLLLKDDDHQDISGRAERQDEGKWLIFIFVCFALAMCLFAIFVNLSHIPNQADLKYAHIGLSLITIGLAWLLVHTIFAIHYAHDFYIEFNKEQSGGLEFPNTPKPLYSDFIYFSYVVGTASQTADVSISSRKMRVLNTLHILFAFTFNTIILAICINIAASLITS